MNTDIYLIMFQGSHKLQLVLPVETQLFSLKKGFTYYLDQLHDTEKLSSASTTLGRKMAILRMKELLPLLTENFA